MTTSRLVLDVVGARFAYPGRAVLRGLDLAVHRGEIVVLLGQNGAGKSTLIRALTGRLALDAGTISIDGGDPRRDSAARRIAGFVPQKVAVYERLTVIENLVAFAQLMQVEPARIARRVQNVLGFVRLADRANDLASTLSGGMRRRLNIGAALVHLPHLLVLDEPTAGVDVEGRAGLIDVLRSLQRRGMAILLVTHDMAEAEALATRVAVLVDGAIAADGTPHDLVETHFGRQRHITIDLGVARDAAPAAGDGNADAGTVMERLGEAGLARQDSSGVWSGFVDAEAAAADLVGDVLTHSVEARAVHVRRPGLDTLLARLSERRA